MWDYLSTYFKKPAELQRIEKLSLAIMKTGIFAATILPDSSNALGWHNHYKNQSLWLQLDSPQYKQPLLDSIDKTPFIIRKKAGEKLFITAITSKFSQYLNF